jgi:hydrogenase maturation factor
MNLLYRQIVEAFPEDGMFVGKIWVGGAMKEVFLALLIEPQIGDRILICDGVAISKVEPQRTTEINYVSGNTG